jgi:lipoate-protein ligase A
MEAPHCRLLPYHVADGAWNMAVDEVLLESAADGLAALRFYGWSQPTLSLGYFQASAPPRHYLRLGELAWVRRASGGAALVHHLEVTYALALPAGPPWQKRGESWLKKIHGFLHDALADLGVSTRLCGDDEERKRDDVLCFLHHTPGDLLIGDAKVAGSAQRKQRGALLQHGGILLAASPFTPILSGIRELTGQTISAESLCAAVTEQFARRTGWHFSPADWSPAERRRIDELIADKYTRPVWNHKR